MPPHTHPEPETDPETDPETTPHRVCVLGAGHSAHVTAGLVASLPGWSCRVYAPRKNRAQLWREGIARGGMKVEIRGEEIQGAPERVSKHAEEVVPGCDVLVMCLPAQAYPENMHAVAPHVDEGAWIGTICGTNGVDWCIDGAMAQVGRAPDSYGVFALQNLPWACRAVDYGERVQVLGAKPFMEIAGRPGSRVSEISAILSAIIRVPCPPVGDSFLGIGLSNLTQVIHPAVMYDNFAGWDGRTPWNEVPLFYQGMTEQGADLIHRVSSEIMALKELLLERFPELDLGVARHIWDWTLRAYGDYIDDPSTLRTRFATNRAFEGLTCPMIPAEGGGWVPDFTSRYLTEDIPYNLVAVKGLALLAGHPTPTIDEILLWAQEVMGREYLVDGTLTGPDVPHSFAPQRFGYHRIEDLPELGGWGEEGDARASSPGEPRGKGPDNRSP